MEIPAEVYTKYTEAMSLFLNEFGIDCTFVYTSIEPISQTDSVKRKLMSQPVGPAGMQRGSEHTKVVETTEIIPLRVYRDKKSFRKVGDISVPDGGCMTIGTGQDLPKMKKASYIIIESEKFQRICDPQVWGLDSNYSVCWWQRV